MPLFRGWHPMSRSPKLHTCPRLPLLLLVAGLCLAFASSGFGDSEAHAAKSKRAKARIAVEPTSPAAKRRAARARSRVRLVRRSRRAQQMFGVHQPGSPEQSMDPVESLQQSIERPVEIVNWYQHWDGWAPAYNRDWAERVIASGRAPLITWEPWRPTAVEQPAFSLARIADGTHDDYISAWAHGVASTRGRVYLRPMHEMNGNWYPWAGTVNGNSAKTYIAAWRRLHKIFDRVGADNVRWVWSPFVDDVPNTQDNRFESYYPGSRYVDVLSLDGYNWGAEHPDYGGWRSFRTVFLSAYRRITKLGPQPVWIAETASAPEGGEKARWVAEMFSDARKMSRIEAIIWFNVDKERDWRLDSVAEAFHLSR